MNNVYQIGSGDLSFELIERILTENLKLELAPEAKARIQRCRDYLDQKIAQSDEPPRASARCATRTSPPTNWARCKRTSSRAMRAAWAKKYAPSSSS